MDEPAPSSYSGRPLSRRGGRRRSPGAAGGWLGRFLGAVLAAALAGALAVACTPREPLRIGFLAGLSGPAADLGNGAYNGARLAVEEFNALGGVQGRTVELLVRDDKGDRATAQQQFGELAQAGVELVIGPTTSTMALALAPLADERRVALLSPTATTAELSGRDDHFLRLVAPLTALAREQARHLYQLGARKLVLATGGGNPTYVANYSREVIAAFRQAGGTVEPAVAYGGSEGAATSYELTAQAVLASRPDALLMIAAGGDVALLALQVRKLGGPKWLASAHWADTPRLLQAGGADIEGLIVTQYFDPDSRESAFLQFAARYRERFSEAPGFAGIYGYDTTRYALAALAKRTPGQSAKQALLALPVQSGLQGPLQMDAHGDGLAPAKLAQVRGGKIVALPR
jgi:branched-chain amino acid transport system substrate-binding protein